MSGNRIVRVVFKEILSGDRKKFTATSNDNPEAGGGARDLRFSPYSKFAPIFEKLMPEQDEIGIRLGRFHWLDGEDRMSVEAKFHPPTNARPHEGRLANVDKCLPLDQIQLDENGTEILILAQDSDGAVWPYVTTADSLRSRSWDPVLQTAILNCLGGARRSGTAMVGYIDFENGDRYCNEH